VATDALGNAVTGPEPGVSALDDFTMGFLSYEARAANVLAVAERYGDLPLAQIYAGMLWMFLESPDAAAKARAHILAARALLPVMTDRERLNLAFLEAWAQADVPRCLALALQAGVDHPRDLVLMKLGQYHAFNRGDAALMLRLVLQVAPRSIDIAYVHGMAAFGYEQCHLLGEAEAAANRALTMREREPWAQHALAHVMLTQGRVDEGARFMQSASTGWTGLNSFMSTHNFWHLALFRISQGRDVDALALYDQHVWGVAKDYSQDQIGAVSLLARLEWAGVDVGARWADVGAWLKARAGDVVQPFLTLHYLFGLARAGLEETDMLRAAIDHAAQHAPQHARAAWSEVAAPAADGLLALVRGDGGTAATLLGRALPRLQEIGGSHAQRDFFEQAHLAALLADRRWSAAQQALELRRRFDPDGVPLNRALASVYRALELPDQAAAADARVGAAAAGA
jgi:hypothetical protein